jgi:hypothetical protein
MGGTLFFFGIFGALATGLVGPCLLISAVGVFILSRPRWAKF